MKTLLKEKDIELLKQFKETEYLSNLEEDITIEMHVYDLLGNHIYSKHKIEEGTYSIVAPRQGYTPAEAHNQRVQRDNQSTQSTI